jgi:hypothetical protein
LSTTARPPHIIQVCYHHFCPLTRQCGHTAWADSRCATCYDGDLAFYLTLVKRSQLPRVAPIPHPVVAPSRQQRDGASLPRRSPLATALAPRCRGWFAGAPGLIVPTIIVCRFGFVNVKRRINAIGVMPLSRSSRCARRQRSHCSSACFPSVGAPLRRRRE